MTTPGPARSQATEIFRQEALDHHERVDQEGRVLRLSPAWTAWAYWLLLLATATGVAYAAVGRVHEYASGLAVVRVDGRTDVTARAASTVSAALVRPGQRVQAGELLVRLYVADESAELQRIEREFELQLVKVLRDPADQAARQALTALRAQRELAEARLAHRSVRAPHAGVVTDLRIRPGQPLAPGDVILSVVGDEARYSIVAFLPGHYRPRLRPGQPLRLELSGYPYAYQRLVLDWVGDEVIGPGEVRRFLGPELGDAVVPSGPVVLVGARLPSASFVTEGRRLGYYDGMQGKAEAVVKSEPILVTLVPGLKALLERGEGR